MKIDIKEISKINLEKGDVLVIKCKKSVPFEFDRMVSEIFPNNKVIIARLTDEFSIIKQELLK